MSILKAPVKGYTGTSFGIRFVDGLGECKDPFLASRLENKGYKVIEEVEEVEEVEDKAPEKPLEELDYESLQAKAKELGIKANQSTEKLIEAIKGELA